MTDCYVYMMVLELVAIAHDETAHKRRGPTGRESDLSFQLVRQPLIVVVKKRDPFALRMIGAGIACSGGRERVRIDNEL